MSEKVCQSFFGGAVIELEPGPLVELGGRPVENSLVRDAQVPGPQGYSNEAVEYQLVLDYPSASQTVRNLAYADTTTMDQAGCTNPNLGLSLPSQ